MRQVVVAVIGLAIWLAALYATWAPGHARPGDLARTVEVIADEFTHLAIWVAVWAMITHLLQGRSRLAEHTRVATTFALIDIAVLGSALPWTFFAMGWAWPASLYVMSHTALITLAGLLHLRLAYQGLNRTRWALWLLASTLALSVMAARQWAEHNSQTALNKLNYQPNIYPATLIKTPEHGLEDGLKAMWARDWGPPRPASAPQTSPP
jgi:hypothetical protein